MTNSEEYDLIILGFTEEEIKEVKKAQKTARADMREEDQNCNDAKESRTDY